MSLLQAAALLGALASTATAHGHVSGIVADGTYYQGYDPSFQYQQSPPAVPGWSCPQCLDNGFVDPTMYTNTNIACHKSATAGQASAKVAAGGKVDLQWTTWPESHHGPVLDYLAKCDGDCKTATEDGLKFVKIGQSGLIDDSKVPGTWASDNLISNNNTWSVTIPSTLAPGNYVLRHEIIALHSAGQENGAQNYPQCINLEVTGSGTANLDGAVSATTFYTPTDPGIKVNIYASLTYEIPGPALWSGAASSGNSGSTGKASGASSAAPATSAPVATSAAASSARASSVAVSSIAQNKVSTAAAAVTTAAPVATSQVAAISVIESITKVLPSSLLTAAIPTAIPTGGNSTGGAIPSKGLPEGITLKDLLEWISYILRNFGRRGGEKAQEARVHPRQFAAPSGTDAPSGVFPTDGARPSGHHSRRPRPTGGFAAPSGHHGHGPHSRRPHGTGVAAQAAATGGAAPSGVFPVDGAKPSGHHGHHGHGHHSRRPLGTGAGASRRPRPTGAFPSGAFPTGGFPQPTGGFPSEGIPTPTAAPTGDFTPATDLPALPSFSVVSE